MLLALAAGDDIAKTRWIKRAYRISTATSKTNLSLRERLGERERERERDSERERERLS